MRNLICLFVIFWGVFFCSNEANAQKVTLDLDNAKLETVLEEIL